MNGTDLFMGLSHISRKYIDEAGNDTLSCTGHDPVAHTRWRRYVWIAAIAALLLLLVGCGAYIITRKLNWSKQLEKDLIFYNEDTGIGGVSKNWSIGDAKIELSAAPPVDGNVEITCNEWSLDAEGTLNIGAEYWIEKWNGKTYEEIAALDGAPWIVSEQKVICGTESSWTVNYLEKYGSLEPGNYRIGMMVLGASGSGESAQLGCFAKFRIQETNMAPCLEAYTKAFLALQNAEYYHIVHMTYPLNWDSQSEYAERRNEIWKSGNDYVDCLVVKEQNAREFTLSGSGQMLRSGVGYGLGWKDGRVSDKPDKWEKVDFVDDTGFELWTNYFGAAYQYAVDVQNTGDQLNIIIPREPDGEYYEIWAFFDAEGKIKKLEYAGVPSLTYGEEERKLLETVEVLPASEEQAAEVLKGINVINPAAFSFEEDLRWMEANGYATKTDGFQNTTAQGQMNAELAIRLADAEISSKTNIAVVFFDQSAEIWKVELTYSQNDGIYYEVYLDNMGITQLIAAK